MEAIDYSVIIRTIGNAHEKYQKLLDSISRLEPQPKEVIVVLPEGFAPPDEQLGNETFLFCEKGMVRQRMEGIYACKTKYALICDDDVSFSPDFVSKLHVPIDKGLGAFSAGPLYSFLPEKGLEKIICTVMASAVPTLFHRKSRYCSVLKSTGYSYNRHLNNSVNNYYESQSVAWTCFYADISALKKLDFMQETWLDAHGYSALDDQTMFYKAWLMGLKTIVVADAEYIHMDAKTSTRNNKPAVLFSRSYNRIVFWHRFIYLQQHTLFGRILSQAAFCYRLIWLNIWNRLDVLRNRMSKSDYNICAEGFREAKKYLKTEEYQELPPFNTKNEGL